MPIHSRARHAALAAVWLLTPIMACVVPASALPAPGPEDSFGPYNSTFLAGGVGDSRALSPASRILAAGAPWSVTGWVRPTLVQPGVAIIVAMGDLQGPAGRALILQDGRFGLSVDGQIRLTGAQAVDAASWHAVAATYDGTTAHLYVDGRDTGAQVLTTRAITPQLHLAPDATEIGGRSAGAVHFGGSVAQLRLHALALSAETIQRLSADRPRFDLIVFHQVGVGWPWQVKAWRGLLQPQDPWTLPQSRTPPSAPVASPVVGDGTALHALSPSLWAIGAWRLTEAGRVTADGARLSQTDFRDDDWYPAVVPGTVLTTLIARGVYPDPYYGLNNMAIPESLARQDYWYRSVFAAPAALAGRQLALTFQGINYAAEVWLNGERLGEIRGAFIRGTFDVTGKVKSGERNVLAVRISPAPHPGIPHEESIAAGPGENGGNLAIDGPTFVAAEGWDWIPGIRDRNSGIWQDVQLKASGGVRLLNPQVVTHLPLPKTDHADVVITVEVENSSAQPAPVTLEARFEGVSVRKAVTAAAGRSTVTLEPKEFPQLHLTSPRLWWPNGYGAPELYTLDLTAQVSGRESDSLSLRFGIRELTYELSLFDHQGRLRRVEVDPAQGTARAERLVDVRHEAIKKTPNGWAASLTTAGESSPAVREVSTQSLAPYLVIRVNGVPIAARGGSWGTDDALKRVSRERLEPYFQLHRAAHLNIIRNWLGQDTEEVFYELADEYGLLILNDFWASTQDFQVEPQDPQLFLANARDVITRFRNHPSIAVWFGRNEGVPQPILNEGLAELVATLDGTRYFTGSSNMVNLQGSGPYNYRPPEQYFTELARGFSVEVGSPSLSTLESLQASIPEAERWPISDTLAYHDWHFGGNGDVATFMSAMSHQYGDPVSLEDFERKAQMMNLVTYRALFEGFQAHLWTLNSGRLLWMTHPSWPSNMWQIYSSDYDTAAPYYAVKAACEPVHAQLNLPDYSLAIVNTTREPRQKLTLTSRIVSLDNRVLAQRADKVSVAANAVLTLPPIEVSRHLAHEGVVLVALTLRDAKGTTLSESLTWQSKDESSLQRLNSLARQQLALTAHAAPSPQGARVSVEMRNRGAAPALAAKLTVLDEHGKRALPVYYSDNYVSLLPGESKTVEIDCPSRVRCMQIALRGWNVEPAMLPIGAGAASVTQQSRTQ
jgi:beta-galactosidase/beta-glucuronidase